MGKPKHVGKKIAFCCMFSFVIGWSWTSLHKQNSGVQPSLTPADGAREFLKTGYDVIDPIDDASQLSTASSFRIPADSSLSVADKHDLGSLFHSVSEKFSSWNPWGKGANGHGSTLDHLLESGSLQQTEEVVTSPARTRTGESPTIGKITIITGNENTVYEQALRTHNMHNRIHDYSMHTLRQSILNDVWSKPAYILSVIMRELAKPAAQRLQWLFWVDADTIIINPHVPLEVFLPPLGFNDVHLLVSHDFNGLNNGVFPIRVHPWSVELLAAVLAYPIYKPDEYLLFRDQSAMGELLKTPKFARHTVLAPQRWFNAYQGEINETIAPYQTRPGDLLVHFAGVPNRDERMEFWLQRAKMHLLEWEVEFKHTSYATETKEFWDDLAGARSRVRKEAEELKVEAAEREALLRAAMEKYKTLLNEEQMQKIEQSFLDLKKVFDNDDTKENIAAIRTAMEKMKEGTAPLQDLIGKETKQLLTSAHSLIFAAENLLFTNLETTSYTRPESDQLESTIAHFKETLLKEPVRPDAIMVELDILLHKQQEYSDKLQAVKAEIERMAEADKAAAEAQAELVREELRVKEAAEEKVKLKLVAEQARKKPAEEEERRKSEQDAASVKNAAEEAGDKSAPYRRWHGDIDIDVGSYMNRVEY